MIFIFGHLVPIYLSLFLLFVLFYLYYDFWLHFICSPRLLHSPSLVVIGLVGYETWPPIDWHHPFVISWFKYRLGLFSVVLCAHGTSGNYHRFSDSSDSPLHSSNGCKWLPLGLCMGTVKEKFIYSTTVYGVASMSPGPVYACPVSKM